MKISKLGEDLCVFEVPSRRIGRIGITALLSLMVMVAADCRAVSDPDRDDSSASAATKAVPGPVVASQARHDNEPRDGNKSPFASSHIEDEKGQGDPLAEPMDVPEQITGKIVLASNERSVYFAAESTQLTESAMREIKRHADRLCADRSRSLTLTAFSDDDGSTSYGIALGAQRAELIRQQLLSLNVAPSQIHITSFSQEKYAVVSCKTDSCRASSRRVQFQYSRPTASPR